MYNKWFQDYQAEQKLENESPVEVTNDETEKEEEIAAPNWAWEPEQSDAENEENPEENAREEYEENDEDDVEDVEGLSI